MKMKEDLTLKELVKPHCEEIVNVPPSAVAKAEMRERMDGVLEGNDDLEPARNPLDEAKTLQFFTSNRVILRLFQMI